MQLSSQHKLLVLVLLLQLFLNVSSSCLSLLWMQLGGRVVQLSIVNKAISANVGALGGLSALTHLDLRNCSRLGGAWHTDTATFCGRYFLLIDWIYVFAWQETLPT